LDWAQSPLLLGYNATKPKPTADVLLATERGEPLFATWRYGLGQTAAFTSDAKARWAGEWLTWPGYAKFWAQVSRGLLRKAGGAGFSISRTETGNELELQIDAVTPEGAFRNRLPITLTARSADAPAESVERVTAEQDAPGSYRAKLKLPEAGTTVINVSSPELPDGGTAIAHTRSYPQEYAMIDADEPRLREIARAGGGRFDPPAEDVFSAAKVNGERREDLSNYFLILALVLIPLDIFLRRRAWAH
jgi:Ca-activated chloride channel family protein